MQWDDTSTWEVRTAVVVVMMSVSVTNVRAPVAGLSEQAASEVEVEVAVCRSSDKSDN